MRRTILLAVISCAFLMTGGTGRAEAKPNILWVYAEDMSPLLGCYGVNNPTPAIDQLAGEGVLFERAFTPTPVCSTSRSSLMYGAMATTYGMHNHRSGPGGGYPAAQLPEGVMSLPELMRANGYFTFNTGGKLDFNFQWKKDSFFDFVGPNRLYKAGDVVPWRKRPEGKPFFGMIQLVGGKGRHNRNDPANPADVKLPAYYPDHPSLRRFFAYQYNAARDMDDHVAAILTELEKDGLRKNTIVVFMTDHGMRAVRDKQFCYDGGLHVPMIVSWTGNPDIVPPNTRREEIVAVLDITGTTLDLAGIDIPDSMACQTLFGQGYEPRDFIIGVRDRCDFTIDRIRTVRTDRYRYIRNFMTDRPYSQFNYKDLGKRTEPGGDFEHIGYMKQLFKDGKLNERQAWFWADERPAEELYDHQTDPDETINLASDPAYKDILDKHRTILNQWINDTDDQGQYPESDEALRAILKRWGEHCVNVEYDKVRAKEKAE